MFWVSLVVAWFFFGLAGARLSIAYDKATNIFNHQKPDYGFYWLCVLSGPICLVLATFFYTTFAIKSKDLSGPGARFRRFATTLSRYTFGV